MAVGGSDDQLLFTGFRQKACDFASCREAPEAPTFLRGVRRPKQLHELHWTAAAAVGTHVTSMHVMGMCHFALALKACQAWLI